jgi:hypothetical protein
MPATDPSALRLMNGTTENVAPSAIWTKTMNTIIAGTANTKTFILANVMSDTPDEQHHSEEQHPSAQTEPLPRRIPALGRFASEYIGRWTRTLDESVRRTPSYSSKMAYIRATGRRGTRR